MANVLPSRDLGTTLHSPRTAREIVVNAGINEEISKIHLYRGDGSQVDGFMGLTYGDHLTGIVGNRYEVMQTDEAIEAALGRFIKSGQLIPQEAGILGHGKKVWLASKLDIPLLEVTPGDQSEARILSLFDNTGKGAWLHVLSCRRIACENSFNIVVTKRDELIPAVRMVHKGNPLKKARIDGQIFCQAAEAFKSWGKDARHLANTPVTDAQKTDYLNILFPSAKDTKRDSARVTRESINRLSIYGQGQNNPAVRGTYWALFNGVTEHLDHRKTYRNTAKATRADNRFQSVMLGDAAKKKQQAFSLALEMATV